MLRDDEKGNQRAPTTEELMNDRIKTLKSDAPITKVYTSDQDNSSIYQSQQSDTHRSPQVTARNSITKSNSQSKDDAANKKRGRRGYADDGHSDIW